MTSSDRESWAWKASTSRNWRAGRFRRRRARIPDLLSVDDDRLVFLLVELDRTAAELTAAVARVLHDGDRRRRAPADDVLTGGRRVIEPRPARHRVLTLHDPDITDSPHRVQCVVLRIQDDVDAPGMQPAAGT